jgi:ribosomal-protein-alanine acetyltransferase
LAIREAELDDLDQLEAIENAAFKTDRLSRRSLRYYIQTETAVLLVSTRGKTIAGYSLVAFRRGARVARLYSIALQRQERGRGLGGSLLAASEKAARGHGATSLRLEVRASNRRAIKLYKKAGYQQFGRIDDYYEDGATALRLEKVLKPASSDRLIAEQA